MVVGVGEGEYNDVPTSAMKTTMLILFDGASTAMSLSKVHHAASYVSMHPRNSANSFLFQMKK